MKRGLLILSIFSISCLGCSTAGTKSLGSSEIEVISPFVVSGLVSSKTIYFQENSFSLSHTYESALREEAKILRQQPELHVEVQGHCSQTGTTEYSLALAEQRAEAVAAMLATVGAPLTRVHIVTFGAEMPRTNAGQLDRQQNDRVQLMFYRETRANDA